eukprot:gene9311-19329_t
MTSKVLSQIMFLTEPVAFGLRGRALECLGHIAVGIGKEHFAPYMEMGMRSTLQGIELVDDSLQEYGYIFIANCVKVMKEAFHPHLQSLVPHLLEVITEAELSPVDDDEDDDEEDLVVNADDDEDDEGADMQLNVTEGFINTKKASLTAIGALAEHTGAAFLPHLPSCLDGILNDTSGCVHSFHKAIRGESLSVLPALFSVSIAAHGPTSPPSKGETVQLESLAAEVCRVCFTSCVASMEEDSERTVVASACEALTGILGHVGMACLSTRDSEGNLLGERLMKAIYTLLIEKGKCQTDLARDCEDDDENGHDSVVMDNVCELIGAIARVSGPAFIPYFEHIKAPLLKFTKPSRIYTDRSVAIGCFAEVLDEIGPPAAALYRDVLLPLIQTGLADETESVRRNCAYCLGALCVHSGESLAPHYTQLLQWLRPLCTRPTEQLSSDAGGADVDNALSAVAKMIKTIPSAVPLPQVLPVMLDALPLRADMLESTSVYSCIISLLQAGEPTAMSNYTKILRIFAEALREGSKVPDEAKAVIASGLRAMATIPNHQAALHNSFGEIPEDWMKAVITSAIQ